MHIAVEGCAHGELEKIYETVANIEKHKKYKVELLICCGDFQASRNLDDLETMSVPKKYQDICTFYKYYSGEKIAPILTIFIGGNHEASNHLQELPYGGWVAPNIYYLGYAGVVNVNGIRIAGISGIYKGHDFLKGHHEYVPYTESTRKSVYHTRQLEVFRLKQLSGNIDIFLSHDWPRGIYNFGNAEQLIRFKPHFREDIKYNRLGSPACEDLLNSLQPSYWFSAHMHCKFIAAVPHDNSGKTTKFLALDKCLPRRRFLQILEINPESEYENNDEMKIKFEYDLEWLTILYLTNHLINAKNTVHYMPGPGNNGERYNFTPTDEEKNLIRKKFGGNLCIPENFTRNTEPYNPDNSNITNQNPSAKINSQTVEFCDRLGVDDPLNLAMAINGLDLSQSSILTEESEGDYTTFIQDSSSDQISFNSTLNETVSPLKRKSLSFSLPKPKNSEEVNLNLSDDDEEDDEHLQATTSTTSDNSQEIVSSEKTFYENSTIAEESIDEKSNKDESNPPIKKFKRRNQDMYKTTEDE